MIQEIKNLIRLYKVAKKANEIYKTLKSCNPEHVRKMKFHAITLDDWSINYSELVGNEEIRLKLFEGYVSVSKDYKCIVSLYTDYNNNWKIPKLNDSQITILEILINGMYVLSKQIKEENDRLVKQEEQELLTQLKEFTKEMYKQNFPTTKS
jgi:hypothetical protein